MRILSSVVFSLAGLLAFATPPRDAAAVSVGPLGVSAKLSLGKAIFGSVGTTTKPKLAKLANKGDAPIAILGIAVHGDFAIDPVTTTCGSTLDPKTKCVVGVTFTPTALGARSGQLIVTHDAAGSPQAVALSGTGVAGKLTFTPGTLKFPTIPLGENSPPQTLVVNNPNLVPVPISTIELTGGDFRLVTRTCGTSLAAGADCTIDVDFRPDAVGSRSGVLQIIARTARNPKNVKLKGKAVGPECVGPKGSVLTDEANCGGCGNICPTTCTDGACDGGTLVCGVATPDVCTCGSTTVCTSFQTDAANCGGCGRVCYDGQTCVRGECAGCSTLAAPDQCGVTCTNFQNDPLNCGGCGTACASGLCVAGQCVDCPINAAYECGGGCTDVLTDEANCGGCGNECPVGVSCVDGQCAGIVCGEDTPDQCGSRCTNTQTDAQNCGTCGNACASESCVTGECVTCEGDTPVQCGATCTDLTVDHENCGACGNQCPAGSICSGGSCVAGACASLGGLIVARAQTNAASAESDRVGLDAVADAGGGVQLDVPGDQPHLTAVCSEDSDDPDACGLKCTNLKSDVLNCGACNTVCSNQPCSNGKCVPCGSETPEFCGTACVDFLTDNKNCGGCATKCESGEICIRGICQKGAECSGIKTNVNIDPNNCGACGNKCTGGPCVRGNCKTLKCDEQPKIVCNGICVDPTRDSRNCGACGVVCDGTAHCSGTYVGKCSPCGDALPDQCGPACTSVLFDAQNCGSCGHACANNEFCHLGDCLTCEAETPTRCGDTCADLQTDNKNCGVCGKFCGDDSYCFQGACTKCASTAPSACDNRCTNLLNDAGNCGQCEYECGDEEKCVQGKCKGCNGVPKLVGGGGTLGAEGSSVVDGAQGGVAALGTCSVPCQDPTPDACGETTCVNFLTDAANCGGCGNACAPNAPCVQGVCAPGQCGTFKVTAFAGTVSQTPTDICGGSESLSASAESIFHLTPSPTVPGGCDVSGNLVTAEGGGICGTWAGPWTCGGTVAANGTFAVSCVCVTQMTMSGVRQGDTYSGGWSFAEDFTDDNGDGYTDSASGSFTLGRE